MAYSRARRPAFRLALLAAVVVVAAGGLWLGGTALLRATGLAVPGGEPTLDPWRYATPVPTPVEKEPGRPVPPAAPAPPPDGAALQSAVDALRRDGVGDTAWVVFDPRSELTLAGGAADAHMVPASTQKLLTSAAALAALGADHRFATKAVAAPGGVTLVGGGDPYLTAELTPGYPSWASLAALADATAAALLAGGVSEAAVTWDDSWFAGTGWNDNWDVDDNLYVTVVGALAADHGVTAGFRSGTPAADAAARFAAQLQARGVQASVGGPAPAAADAAVLAEVLSPPLSVVIQECLLDSDNDTAEVLFRQVDRARGGDGSLASAHATAPAVLAELGLWTDGMAADDGSGLSRANRVSPLGLVRVLGLAMRDEAYRPLLSGLPTAGADGTLTRRFNDPAEAAGRGQVRAKTGSLTGVNTLAGVVRTQSGAQLAFAFMANNTTDDWAASDWADGSAALVAAL
ncbi:MAG: D-alanyl-D-alanine carboxypeptidase/D-alanyl-D-alanine-endopeptidase [Propionibacteriaceae bacterium]|jgi:D-alanyl-D-alanine carboxypeptidase/D-alanyl-D-alanine-endopeptidase (penicillin-binding protein 4)|nr:D-alanyl-D-alanine carboxypeptidase/D-alanyl-D-alanine-endopeptidase [Propionibacteriaceae bacterium]